MRPVFRRKAANPKNFFCGMCERKDHKMKFIKKPSVRPGALLRYCIIYICILFAAVIGVARSAIPSRQVYFGYDDASPVLNVEKNVSGGSYTVTAKLFGTIPVKQVNVEVIPDLKLVPCGDVFGVKFFTKGVIVIGSTEIETENGFVSPAQAAGIEKNDIITEVNGTEINTVEALAEVVEKSKGKPLTVSYTRENQVYETTLTPQLSLSDKKYKTGIWVRDSTAGIGTLTYYNPQNGCFAGLGHGICDIDTGELMPLLRGTIVDVNITDIVKGKSGSPGELKGVFETDKTGALIGNTDFGVYGMLDNSPTCVYEVMPVASRNEVEAGEATILSNVDGNGIKEYDVTLSKVDVRSDGTKCFVVEITDERLIELTGGIVQGMSGSPILQNGKIVGAVTHVLVGDPTKGYGIFIENMLSAMPELLQ